MTITIHRSDLTRPDLMRYTMRERHTQAVSRIYSFTGLYISVQVETGDLTPSQDSTCYFWEVIK